MNEYLNELFVSVESGEITAEDAAELYNIFSEAEETEESGGAHQKLAKIKAKEHKDIEDKIEKLRKLKGTTENPKLRDLLSKKIDRLLINDGSEIKDMYFSGYQLDEINKRIKDSRKGKKAEYGDFAEILYDLKDSIGSGKHHIPKKRKAGEFLKVAKALKESVTEDDLKLAIYEAFESGEITEDEKYELLSDLY